MQEFLLKKVCFGQAAQQPSYSCLDLNHSSHAGVPHQMVFEDRMNSALRNFFGAGKCTAKKGTCFIFACENEVLPLPVMWTRSSHLLGLLYTTRKCIITSLYWTHGEQFYFCILIESKWGCPKVKYCMNNTYFICVRCFDFVVFSPKGLWY